MLYALIALSVALSYISIRSSFYPLKWVAGFAWWGLLTYWIGADLLVDGTPPDVVFMLLFIMLGILFLLWGFAGRKGTFDIEEEHSSTGSVVRRIVRSTRTSEPKPTPDGNVEYRLTVRKALNRGSKSRRKK